MPHVFDRSGLASLDDLMDLDCKILFKELETAQSLFALHEKKIISKSYKWPRRPLYWWSRCWEYPYVLYQIRKWKNTKIALQPKIEPKIVDLGCGVTFFPFCIAQENCSVIGVDIDPVAEKALAEAAAVISIPRGSVSFRVTNGELLPFEDNEIDAFYCVSVLEHIPDPTIIIKEVARVLTKGGLFVLTIDIDLKGNFDIGPDKFNSLVSTLQEYFVWNERETTVHPTKLLKSNNGPYPWNVESGLRKYLRPIKEFIKSLIGRDKHNRFELACYGIALTRK